MDYLKLFARLAPFMVSTVKVAEELFNDQPKSGEAKKELVVGATRAVVGGIHAVSTGGQKETWVAIAPAIDIMVDATASVLFGRED